MDGTTCRNAYSDRVLLSQTQCTAITVVMIAILIMTLPTNSLLVAAILKTKLNSAVSYYYMLFFAMSGCCLGIIIIPINIVLFTAQRKTTNCHLEYTAIFLGQITCQFTAYVTILIAMYRYFLSIPDENGRWDWFRSRKGAVRLTIIVFLISTIHGFASVNFFGQLSSSLPNFLLKLVDFILGFAVYCIYLRLYIRIRKYSRNLSPETADPDNASRIQRRSSGQNCVRELAVTISLILMAVAVCYVPFIVMDFWTSWYTFFKKQHAPNDVRFVYYITYGCVFFTSVANAVIIIYRDRDIRIFVKKAVWPND